MGLEISVHRSKRDVEEAIVQFAARRSYRLTYPWHLDGPRIENREDADPGRRHGAGDRPAQTGGSLSRLLRRMFDINQPPRVDLELKRVRGKTTVEVDLGAEHRSVQLAYALRAYLASEEAYACLCPAICAVCSAPVRNVRARYCGQCGKELVPMGADIVRPRLGAMDDAGAEPDKVETASRDSTVAEEKPAAEDNAREAAHPARTVAIEREEEEQQQNEPDAQECVADTPARRAEPEPAAETPTAPEVSVEGGSSEEAEDPEETPEAPARRRELAED